jgi:hypothetical protein
MALDGMLAQQTSMTPDATVMEAAETMELRHSHHVLVARDQTLLGVLSAEDILNKVLAAGRDPRTVHVSDIMAAGRFDHGVFFVDEDAEPPAGIFAAETLHSRDDDDQEVLHAVLSGKCEECGVFSEELIDHEGLEMCADCSGFRVALFG